MKRGKKNLSIKKSEIIGRNILFGFYSLLVVLIAINFLRINKNYNSLPEVLTEFIPQTVVMIIIFLAISFVFIKDKNKKWYLGFLGFLGVLGIPEILTKDLSGSLWLFWFVWFIFFIKEKTFKKMIKFIK